MGVKGLWSLLNPVARPVQIESLEGKRLAIDSSIWLYQFQSTMRDKDGRVLVNAHVLGFLRRINKLLFHGIKPVFVFDGGAPVLKRSTIAERKRKKAGAALNHSKMAEKLLAAQMRREAVRLAERAEEERAARAIHRMDYDDEEEGERIADNAVYLDELEGASRAGPSRRAVTTTASAPGALESPEAKRKRFQNKDRYYLPETTIPAYTAEDKPDARLATEAELQQFIDEVNPEDIDIESPEFRALPTEVQYEIIGDLRLRSRQHSHARLNSMLRGAPTALDFSKAQIKQLSQRNALTQQLLTVTDMVGKAHLTIPVRVAAERNREYLLVKRNEDEGGGWALGIREGTKDKPIVLEPESPVNTKKEEIVSDEYSDEDSDMEVVEPAPDDDLRQHRRREVLQAIASRYAPAQPKPSLDVEVKSFGPARQPGAAPLFDSAEEVDFEEIEPTANDEALALALQQEELGSDEEEADPDLARALALSRREAATNGPSSPGNGSDSDEFEEVSLEPSANATPAAHTPAPDSDDEGIEITGGKPAPLLTSLLPPQTPRNEPVKLAALLQESVMRPITAGVRPTASAPAVISASAPKPASARPPVAEVLDVDTSEDEFEEIAPVLPPAPAPPPPVPHVASPQRPDEPETQEAVPHSPTPEQDDEGDGFAPEATLEDEPSRRRGAPSPSPGARSPSPVRGAPSPSPVRGAPSSSPVPELEQEDDDMEPTQLNIESFQSETLQSNGRYVLDSEEEDDDEPIEWSRSPTPLPRPPLNRKGSSAHSIASEADHEDDDGQMAPADMVAEEDDYARFLAQIQNRDLKDVRAEIDDEIRVLNQQTKVAMRDSDEITQAMVVQIQTLLRHFGIPYITAPMEAEAQCAKLAELDLVDGIITDDSDVFLFGGTQCFKNIFNDAKFAECFLATDVERELSLTRERLISLAYLLGSDYDIGLLGVGPVLALELLAEFPGADGLHRFKEWWLKVQNGTDLPVESDTKWKQGFKKRFAGAIHLSAEWPNAHVREAYLYPTADESDEPFHWGFPRLAALRTFLHEELSWSISKVDDELTPIVQRIAKRGRGGEVRQTTLLPFFDNAAGSGASYAPRRRTTANISKRLMAVVKRFREAEALSQGQQPQGWSEMLAGVDEADPKGLGSSKPAKRKSRGDGGKATSKKRKSKEVVDDEDDDDDDEEEEEAEAEVERPKRQSRRRTASAAASTAANSDNELLESDPQPSSRARRTRK